MVATVAKPCWELMPPWCRQSSSWSAPNLEPLEPGHPRLLCRKFQMFSQRPVTGMDSLRFHCVSNSKQHMKTQIQHTTKGSIDCFKGKSTGNHGFPMDFPPEISRVFRFQFSLKPSHMIRITHLAKPFSLPIRAKLRPEILGQFTRGLNYLASK